MVKDLKRKRGEESEEGKAASSRPPYKQRVLVLSSRGISQRQRHLMNDLTGLLPHAKKGECPLCHVFGGVLKGVTDRRQARLEAQLAARQRTVRAVELQQCAVL